MEDNTEGRGGTNRQVVDHLRKQYFYAQLNLVGVSACVLVAVAEWQFRGPTLNIAMAAIVALAVRGIVTSRDPFARVIYSAVLFGRFWIAMQSLLHLHHIACGPQGWTMLGYLLPPRARRTVFEPCLHEYIEDYWTSQVVRTSLAWRIWLRLCYTLWTLYLVGQCWMVIAATPFAKIVALLTKR